MALLLEKQTMNKLVVAFDTLLCGITLGCGIAAIFFTSGCLLADMGVQFSFSKAELESSDLIALTLFVGGTCLSVMENVFFDIDDIEYNVLSEKEIRLRIQIETDIRIQNMQNASRSAVCSGCHNYYGQHNIVCGIYPYGWMEGECPDKSEVNDERNI